MIGSARQSGARPRVRNGVVAVVVCCAMVGATAFLSLSDRAPGLLYSAARRVHLGRFVAHGAWGFEFDTLGHAAVWAAVTLAACVAIGRCREPVIVVAAMAASGLIEVLQATTTDSRAFQMQDVAANAVGIVAAATVVVLARTVHRALRSTSGATV